MLRQISKHIWIDILIRNSKNLEDRIKHVFARIGKKNEYPQRKCTEDLKNSK